MGRKRNIRRVARIGGLCVPQSRCWLVIPRRGADELADLRANQELLQKRIDQLSQAPPPGGTWAVCAGV